MSENRDSSGFELGAQFTAAEVSGGLELGPYASHYQELFAEALEDGVITSEERARLDKAADNLGVDRMQVHQLEQAMISAYEMHHRVKVVEKWEDEPRSLQPIDLEQAQGDTAKAMLLAQIDRLNKRIAELEAELRDAKAHVNVEVDLSSLESMVPPPDESLEQLRARVRRDPTNGNLFRVMFKACDAQGDLDGQFCSAQALVALGAADDKHRELYEKYRRKGLIVPRNALTASHWHDQLGHPQLEVVTSNIMSLIAPAALMGRVAALRREKKLLTLTDENRHDLAKSTVMGARALGWAAAVLGMAPPPVWVDANKSLGYTHVPAIPPFTLVGKQVLSGRSQTQNAFAAARHLTYYRAEFFVKVLFPAVTELEDLFLAALMIGSPGLPVAAHVKSRISPISEALGPMLDDSVRDQLRAQFKAFVEDGGRTNLLRWSESVDKTACRAGLLLCDDLVSVCEDLRGEEGKQGPLATDLLGFVMSERYAALRAHLGIALTRS